ncbi:MAG: glycosyltransferase, partial [Moorea sp. SIO3C2]|nr:glycosyltransferase [Moorena sp. SIO3C2]
DNIHLLIAGDGELAPAMREEIEALGLSEKISMLGALSQQELADLHRVSSAFVLSSAYEGLPLVVLEALACGTPVVTTRAGETPRLLGENSGVVCEERSPQSLADAMTSVLNQPERYSSAACVENAAPYSAQNVIHQIYGEMLKRWVPK